MIGNPTSSMNRMFYLIAPPALLMGLAFGLTACEQDDPEERVAEAEESPQAVEITATYDPEANQHLFELSEEEIPSGWTTFRLVNNSPDEHLAQIFKVPEDAGVTAEVWIEDFIVEVQRVMDRFQDPEIDGIAEAREGAEYPEWWGESSPRGGPGMISPGGTAEATAHLEPGHYIIECYVKDSNEMMHTTLGMAALLTVTDELSDAPEPDADVELTLSDEGIQSSGNVEAGKQTIRVNFEERDTPALTVHLAHLDKEVQLEELSSWMAYWFPGGYVAPAPAEFVGGTGRKPEGQSTYFTVDVEPGDYAWIAEYGTTTEPTPPLEELGWLRTFTVEP